jgi:hypothetical protein
LNQIQFIAYYLPQFHAIPENDEWWGKGFTEWTNVRKAKPLYKGHYQPRIPGSLGYYDLLNSDTMVKQSDMAQAYGIDGFAYWHYWFGAGKRLLEKPAKIMLSKPEVSIPFCFAWANQTWTGIWHGLHNKTLMEQVYAGKKDDERHFNEVLPYFMDSRYIRVDNKPVFMLYRPYDHPYLNAFIAHWQTLALQAGLPGIHFIGISYDASRREALDAVALQQSYFSQQRLRGIDGIYKKLRGLPFSEALRRRRFGCNKLDFRKLDAMVERTHFDDYVYPTILTGWDNTPRSGERGVVLDNYGPADLERHMQQLLGKVKHRKQTLCFVKSWNEWAEGNYLEPDEKFGTQFLEVFKKVADQYNG